MGPEPTATMTTVHANRLLRAAQAVLEAKNPKKFNMGDYFHWCGSPSCVLGFYASRRDLQRFLKGDDGFLSYVSGGSADIADVEVQEHFGITPAEAYELFGCTGCGNAKTPTQAAWYIEEFLKSKGFDIEEYE